MIHLILLWWDLVIILILIIKQNESEKHLSSNFVSFQEKKKKLQEVLSMCLSPIRWTEMFFNLGPDNEISILA